MNSELKARIILQYILEELEAPSIQLQKEQHKLSRLPKPRGVYRNIIKYELS